MTRTKALVRSSVATLVSILATQPAPRAQQPRLVADINRVASSSGTKSSMPNDFLRFGTRLIFGADDGVHGREVWTYDPVQQEAELLVDLAAGAAAANPFGFVRFQGRVVFSAWTPQTGQELFVTDGTRAGTKLLVDVVPGPISSWPSQIANIGGRLYFQAGMDSFLDRELWTSDGTPAGTARFAKLSTSAGGSSPRSILPFGPPGGFAFVANPTITTPQIYVCDGTPSSLRAIVGGSFRLSYGRNPQIVSLGNRLVFRMHSAATGDELAISDGTAAGTSILSDLVPGRGSSHPSEFRRHRDGLLFVFEDGAKTGFAFTNGTAAGTVRLATKRAPVLVSGELSHLTSTGSRFFMFASRSARSGVELWVSDGDFAFQLDDIGVGAADSFVIGGFAEENPGSRQLIALGGDFYFAANDGKHGSELWRIPHAALSIPTGIGCIGNGPAPRLRVTDAVSNQPYDVVVDDAPNPSAMLLVAAPIALRDIRIRPNCHTSLRLTTPLPLLVTSLASRRWQATFRVPPEAKLLGATLGLQSLFFTTRDVATSNAVHVHIVRM